MTVDAWSLASMRAPALPHPSRRCAAGPSRLPASLLVRLFALLALPVFLLVAVPLLAAPGSAAGVGEVQAVVVLHHPYDRTDPFGVPLGSGDTFSARYGHLRDASGNFPFPTLVADGVSVVYSLPD